MDKRNERSEYSANAALSDTARMRLPTFTHGQQDPTTRRGGTAAQALAECERAALLKRLGV